MAEKIKEITVLYYEQDDMSFVRSDVLTNFKISSDARVIMSKEYRKNKIIVAVLEGKCKLLNSLGDRDIYF